MATNVDINNLIERYFVIENEIKMLQEDRKVLLQEFKEKIDTRAFQNALRSARIKAKLKPHEVQDYEQVLSVLENKMNIEQV